MSYTASCFVSASDCSASDEDTRTGGAVDSSPPRSRDLFGTRPYRTAVTEGSYLKEVGGHNDLLGENVKSETHSVRQHCAGTCSTSIYSYTLQPCRYCLRSLFLCELGGLRRLASNICDRDKITIFTIWYCLWATYYFGNGDHCNTDSTPLMHLITVISRS